jgi:hypothetical protein
MTARELEQDGSGSIVAVADASLSTRCGMRGTPIAATIARSIAALGRSAAVRQNGFGLIAVDHASAGEGWTAADDRDRVVLARFLVARSAQGFGIRDSGLGTGNTWGGLSSNP